MQDDIPECFSFQEHCSIKDLTDLAAESDGNGSIGYEVNESIQRVNIKCKSDFYPVITRTKRMDRFQKCVERDLIHLTTTTHITGARFDNPTMDDKSTLRDLQDDVSIVIRNSDKGGMVVVMDASVYHDEAIRQLSDQNIYMKLLGDPTRTYRGILYNLIKKGTHLGVLSIKEAESLIPECPIIATFHHLPKTHKGLDPLYGRPIVAGISSLNERLRQWLDGQLHPIVSSLPSFLKDTNHLLNAMREVVWRSICG